MYSEAAVPNSAGQKKPSRDDRSRIQQWEICSRAAVGQSVSGFSFVGGFSTQKVLPKVARKCLECVTTKLS
jgi:hypothetical protein